MFSEKFGGINHPLFLPPLLLYAIILLCASMLSVGSADHTTMCINLPGELRYKRGMKSMGMEKFPQTRDLWGQFQESIVAGAAQLEMHHEHRQGFFESQDIFVTFRVYMIKNKRTKQYLNGWYRVELDMVKPKLDLQRVLKALVLYAHDDSGRRQTIGEFALHFPDQGKCPKNDANKYMIISCGGASRSEPLVSNMIVLVRNNTDLDGNIFPAGSENIMPSLVGRHTLNFYIRIPIQDCNQKKYILMRAKMVFDKKAVPNANHKQDVIRMASIYWRIEGGKQFQKPGKIPGGSDALPSPSNARHLDCAEEITLSNMPWYGWDTDRNGEYPFQNVRFSTNFDTPESLSAVYACQGFYFRGRCADNFYTLSSRYLSALDPGQKGMRLLKNQNQAEENTIPVCEHKPDENAVVAHLNREDFYVTPVMYNNFTVVGGFSKTHDYLKTNEYPCSKVYNEDKTCSISMVTNNIGARTIRRRPHVIRGRHMHMVTDERSYGRTEDEDDENSDYVNYTGNDRDVQKDMYKGIGFNETGFPKIIWGLRKGHASLMVLAMFFVLPVNLFITRYYKESFMDKRLLYSRIWYQVHVQGTFMLAALLFGGLLIAIVAKQYMGVSLTAEAKAHRVFGWLTIFLFILLASSGGFRGYEDPLRKITIWVHWALGLLFYLLMEMITAVFIPASGVTSYDRSLRWRMIAEDREILNGALLHVFVWLIIEMVMHVVMMANMFGFDKRMAIVQKRMYFPVPIPVIKEHSTSNASGHGLRVISLAVYILLALSSTSLYLISNVMNVNGKELGLGPMSCTHEKSTHLIRGRFSADCN